MKCPWNASRKGSASGSYTSSGAISHLKTCKSLGAVAALEVCNITQEQQVAVVQAKTITSETLHELTVKLKSLAVEIGELEGDVFRSVSSDVFNAAESLRSAFRKVENNKLANKRDNRQASMYHS